MINDHHSRFSGRWSFIAKVMCGSEELLEFPHRPSVSPCTTVSPSSTFMDNFLKWATDMLTFIRVLFVKFK